jgi:hypothetical protein
MSTYPGIVVPQIDPTTVTVPATGTVAIVANLSGQITVVKPDGSINPLVLNNPLSTHQTSSSTGNATVGPGSGMHVESVTVTGTATVRQFYLSNVGLSSANAGYRIRMLFSFAGQVAGIGLQVYNSNSAGTLLFNFTTDSVQQNAVADFYWDGNYWQIDQAAVPAL